MTDRDAALRPDEPPAAPGNPAAEEPSGVEQIFDIGEHALSETEKIALGIDPLEPQISVDDEPESEPEPADR